MNRIEISVYQLLLLIPAFVIRHMQESVNLDHCTGFHEQRKHLWKVPLQQKG